MNVPKIPNNSLTEEIKEIVELCEELAPEYGEDASWFYPPESESEIIKWEKENGIIIPDSYKEWLCFTGEAKIRSLLAHFYGTDKFILNSMGGTEDLIVIADLIGDGEYLCFSKTRGIFVWVDHGNLDEMTDFKVVLKEIIRMMKPKNCLSPKMENLLMSMVKDSEAKNN